MDADTRNLQWLDLCFCARLETRSGIARNKLGWLFDTMTNDDLDRHGLRALGDRRPRDRRPVANDDTIVATASAEDRASFGCKPGSDFTAYGRALFVDELAHECSFATALTKANALVAEREKASHEIPSLPQLSSASNNVG